MKEGKTVTDIDPMNTLSIDPLNDGRFLIIFECGSMEELRMTVDHLITINKTKVDWVSPKSKVDDG